MSSLVAIRRRLTEIYGESVNTVTKSDIREAHQLIADAQKALELAIPYAHSVAREIDLSGTAVQIGPMKTIPRIFEKAVGKLGGHLEDVNDTGRMRILIDGPEDVLTLRRMFAPSTRTGKFVPFHPDNHVTVSNVQDYFLVPSKTGRIAYHLDLDVTISGGKSVGIEIQLIDKRMLETDKATHLTYQKASAIERLAKREGRGLRNDEMEAIQNYRHSIEKLYLADSLNYGYYDLRRPDLKAKEPYSHLRLAIA